MKKQVLALAILLLSIGINNFTVFAVWEGSGWEETITYVPAFTGASVEIRDGRQYLIRTYEGIPEYEPDFTRLIEETFEFEGFLYTFSGIYTNEIMREDTKWERMEVSFSIPEDDLQAVYRQLQPNIPYHGNDGYYGTLDLDYTAVWTQVEGYVAKGYTMTDTVTISGLSSNDSSNITKTRTRSGVTMQLQKVDWTVQESTTIGFDTVPTRYTAVAHYSGRYSKNEPSGYLARALYGGYVTRATLDRVVYSIIYLGEPMTGYIPAPGDETVFEHENSNNETEDDEVVENDGDGLAGEDTETNKNPVGFILTTACIALGLVGLAIGAYFYFGNVCVYAHEDGDYHYITRRFVRPSNPVVDLRRLDTDELELAIEVKKRLASAIHMQQIETLLSNGQTYRRRVREKDKDFWYIVYLSDTETAVEPEGDEESESRSKKDV